MSTGFEFYLGTHVPRWLWSEETAGVPMFISYRTLRKRITPFPEATVPFRLDSGGYTELFSPPSTSPAAEWHEGGGGHVLPFPRLREPHRWEVTPEEYVDDVRRFLDELGDGRDGGPGLVWAAPQDWMCEPWILRDTGKTIEEHHRLTVDNFLDLRRLAPDLPFIPVVQGWEIEDYHRHVDMYLAAGIDLRDFDVVGVGSVCRRESSVEAARIFGSLAKRGLRLHGFGVKIDGLTAYADDLVSSDSLAWSAGARRAAFAAMKRRDAGEEVPVPVCGKKTCANCWHYAAAWRGKILDRLATRQLPLFSLSA